MARRLHLVDHNALNLSDGNVTPASSIRNLSTCFNESMDISTHVSWLVRSSFYQFWWVRQFDIWFRLVNSFLISRTDCWNSLLVDLPACRSILNYSVRIMYGMGKYDHMTSFLRNKLHWLCIPQRVKYKCYLLVYKALHGQAPASIQHFCTNVCEVQWCSTLCTMIHNHLILLRFKSKLGNGSFSVAGPLVWNLLPDDIKGEWYRWHTF